MVLWPIYKRLAFRKYLEDNWLAPVVHRKSANCAAHVLGVLRSVGDISPIGTFLAMRLKWLLNDAFKALTANATFTKGFNSIQVKYHWSTTSPNVAGDTRQDMALL
jgi:hypothetical protein